MSDHVLDLLGAYLDGELREGLLSRVEAHLDECPSCLEEYRALKALSGELRGAPIPEFPAPDRFAAQVVLCLPREQEMPARRRALELGLWLAPIALMLAWVFLNTTWFVSALVVRAGDFGLLRSAFTMLAPVPVGAYGYAALLDGLGLLDLGAMPWLAPLESLARTAVSNLSWKLAITLLYLSWMAILWARRMRQGTDQLLESSSRSSNQ